MIATIENKDRKDLEWTIIGACVGDMENCLLLDELRSGDFMFDSPREVFGAVRHLVKAGAHVDELLLRKRLVETGREDAARDFFQWWGTVSSGYAIPFGHLRHYVRQLVELSVRSRLLNAARRIAACANDPDLTLEQLHEKVPAFVWEALARSVPNEAKSEREIALTMAEMAQEIESKEAAGIKVESVAMPFQIARVDRNFEGGCPGETIILAAPPSMGKSALGYKFARGWGRQGITYYWTGEMPKSQLVRRGACQVFGLPREEIRSHHYRELAERHSTAIHIDDEKGINVDRLIQKMQMFRLMHGNLRAAVIDYLGLLCDNDYKEVSRASRKLKAAAGQLNIPILILCQLSRDIGKRVDKAPQMSDLRDSGQIEQDADKVLMLHRPGYYEDEGNRTIDPTKAFLYVRKYRDGERNAIIPLRHDGPTFDFTSWEDPVSPTRPEPELRDLDYGIPAQTFFPHEHITTEEIPL